MAPAGRATRSRYSSPAQTQAPTQTQKQTEPANRISPLEPSGTKANEAASKTFMQRWLEPSVQVKASFEEVGFARHGVLETMAPLGTLPKAKLLAGDAVTGPQKPILKSGVSKVRDDESRPSSKRSSRSPAGSPPPAKRPVKPFTPQAAADSADDDYEPNETTRRRKKRRATSAGTTEEGNTNQDGNSSRANSEAPSEKTLRSRAIAAEGRRLLDAPVDVTMEGYQRQSSLALSTTYDDETRSTGIEEKATADFKQEGGEAATPADSNAAGEENTKQTERSKKRCKNEDEEASISSTPDAKLYHGDDDGAHTRVAKRAKTSHAGAKPTTTSNSTRGSCTRSNADAGDAADTEDMATSQKPARDDSQGSAASTQNPARQPSQSPSLGRGATLPAQPMVADAKASTNKLASTTSNSPSSTTTSFPNQQQEAHGTMPGRLEAPELLADAARGSEDTANQESAPSPMQHDQDESVWNRRREAQTVTNNYTAKDSSVRKGLKADRPSTPVRKTRKTRQSLGAPTSTRATRSAVKRSGDEDGDRAASVAASLAGGEGSSLSESRAVTPTKKPKGSGLRVKSS